MERVWFIPSDKQQNWNNLRREEEGKKRGARRKGREFAEKAGRISKIHLRTKSIKKDEKISIGRMKTKQTVKMRPDSGR